MVVYVLVNYRNDSPAESLPHGLSLMPRLGDMIYTPLKGMADKTMVLRKCCSKEPGANLCRVFFAEGLLKVTGCKFV